MLISVNKINTTNVYFAKNKTCKNKNKKSQTPLKTASLLGSTIGITASAAWILRGKGLNLKPLIKKPSNLISAFKNTEFNALDVIFTAASSVLGGLTGGSLVDPENTMEKAKEGVLQLTGNYIIPSIAVGSGIKLNKALNRRYNFPPITKPVQFLFGLASLIAGVAAGNKAAGAINKSIFKEKDSRKLNIKDWAVQFDNLCLVTSISNSGTALAKAVSKFILPAHLCAGYQVGIKKDTTKL